MQLHELLPLDNFFIKHISPVLQNLHWLPVKYHIHFKILLLTYKSLIIWLPHTYPISSVYSFTYLTICLCTHSCTSSNLTTSMGSRDFGYAAPYLWNSLPVDIPNSQSLVVFKSRIKTCLFMQAFM